MIRPRPSRNARLAIALAATSLLAVPLALQGAADATMTGEARLAAAGTQAAPPVADLAGESARASGAADGGADDPVVLEIHAEGIPSGDDNVMWGTGLVTARENIQFIVDAWALESGRVDYKLTAKGELTSFTCHSDNSPGSTWAHLAYFLSPMGAGLVAELTEPLFQDGDPVDEFLDEAVGRANSIAFNAVGVTGSYRGDCSGFAIVRSHAGTTIQIRYQGVNTAVDEACGAVGSPGDCINLVEYERLDVQARMRTFTRFELTEPEPN